MASSYEQIRAENQKKYGKKPDMNSYDQVRKLNSLRYGSAVDSDYVNQYLSDHRDYWSGYGEGKNPTNYRLDERRAAIDSWLEGSLANGSIDRSYYDQALEILGEADAYVGLYQGQRDVGSYMDDWAKWYNSAADTLGSMDWETGRGGSASLDEGMAGFADRDAAARVWLETYKGQLGEEYYNAMMEQLNSYGGYMDSLRAAYDQNAAYFNQWDSREGYDRYQKLSGMDVDAMEAGLGASGSAILGALYGADLRLQELRRAHDDLYVLEGPYGYLANDTLSPEKREEYQARYDEILGQYGSDVTSESLWEQIQQMETGLSAARDQVVTIKNMADYSAMSDEEQLAFRRYAEAMSGGAISFGSDGKIHSPVLEIQADPEIQAIIAKYGKERVEQIAETLKRDLNQGLAEEASTLGQEIGESLGFGAIPLGVFGGILGTPVNLIGLANEAITGTGQYGTTDPYHTGSMMSTMTQGIGAGGAKKAPEQMVNLLELMGNANPYVAEMQGAPTNYKPQLYEATRGTKAGEVIDAIGSGTYQVINTAADSVVRAYLGGGLFGPGTKAANVLSLGLAGTRSFADTYNEVSAKGGTPTQALLLGVFNGGTEIATEYLPLENWWKIAENGSDSVAAMLKEAALHGGIEMTQEEIGLIATTMAEFAVLREKSEYQVMIRDLMESGMTREEAEMEAWKAFGKELLETGITSFFSGGLSEAGAEAYGAVSSKMQYDALPQQIRKSMVRIEGLGMDQDAALDTSAKLYEMGSKYEGQREAFMAAYDPKQDVYQYASDYNTAWEIGRNNGNREYIGKLSLSESQGKIAYELGAAAGRQKVQSSGGVEVSEIESSYSAGEDGKTVDTTTNEAVEIEGFSSVGKEPKLNLKGGKVIAAKDVGYASADEAVVYETIGKVSGSTEAANNLLKTYRDAEKSGISASDFAAGLTQAYELGFSGQVAERQLGSYELAGKLGLYARSVAYSHGKRMGDIRAAARDAQNRKKSHKKAGAREGKLHFDRKGRRFSKTQEASLGALEALSKALGVDIYVYESYEDGGKRVYQSRGGEVKSAPNGFYDELGIHIDLNAGNFGQGTMMFTAAHELTHFIKQWSPVKFRKLAQLLVDRYAEQGTSVRDLIDNQIVKAKNNGRTIDRDTAFEEVVADSMETMLTQGDAASFMADLKQQDKTLWEKVKQWFKDLAEKLRGVVDAYQGYTPDSPEGRIVAQMEDFIGVLQEAYSEALMDASENYRANEGNKKTTREGGNTYEQAIKRSERIVDQIKNSLGNIMALDNVYTIDSANAPKYSGDRKTDEKTGHNVFLGQGSIAYRPNYGKVFLGKRGVVHTVYHGNGPAKQAAFPAVKAVIEKGIEIYRDEKHNGHEYNTVTFAAPISFFGKKAPLATVVKEFDNGRGDKSFYIHEICDSEGNYIQLESDVEQKTSSTGEVEPTSTADAAVGDNISNNNVTQPGTEVNPESAVKRSDREYLAAVERGDMATAQRMVDEAAKEWGAFLNNAEANEVFTQSGEVRTFYHGTNTGDFTVFDKSLLGNSSGDLGWFGKGFYFAFSSREAATYGGRVINAYLKMRNPYDYSTLYKFKGSDHVSDRYSRFAWLYNIVEQFPDIVVGQKVYAYPNDAEDGSVVSWKQLAKWMDRIEREVVFSVEQVETPYGDTAWELRADPKQESFTNVDGETFTWTEYGMRMQFLTEQEAKEPINQIGAYLANVMGVETIPRRSIEKIDFSGAVQRAGYDGIIQSPSGDEAVVFDPSQIKSSDPVTYDDDGNVIPLSERFDTTKTDIRWSDRDPTAAATAQELEKQYAKLKQDVKDLRELLSLQGKLTKGTEFRKSSIDAAVKGLAQTAGATLDAEGRAQLHDMLKDFYKYIASDDSLAWEGVREKAGKIADFLQSSVKFKPQRSDYANDVLGYLRGQRVSLSDSQRAEVEKLYGYENYRKQLFGAGVYLSKEGISLDSLWHEAAGSDMFPGTFDIDILEGNQPAELLRVIDGMREDDGSGALEYAYNRDLIRQDLIQAVYDSYWRVDNLHTVADRKQREINEIRRKHNERMDALKESHQETVKRLKEERRADIQAVRDAYRERNARDLQKARERYAEARERGRESRAAASQRQIVEKAAKDMMDMLSKPTKDAHVPMALQKPLEKLLNSIDFTSNRAAGGGEPTIRDVAYTRALHDVKLAVAGQRTALEGKEDGTFTLDVPPKFLEEIDTHIKMIQDATEGLDLTTNRVYEMTSDELKDLSYILGTINKAIRQIDRLHMAGAKARVSELGNDTVSEMGRRKPVKGEKGGAAMWVNYIPTFAFERMGKAATQILEGLKRGQGKLARTIDGVIRFAGETYINREVKDWEKETHSIALDSGEKIQMTIAQVMSFYCLSKREQAKGHLSGGGMRIGNIGEGRSAVVQKEHYVLTQNDIARINSLLTDRQLEVANKLQRYMADVGGRLGNEISMARWDYMEMTDRDYFPIKSDSDIHDGKNPDQEKTNLWALLNKSFTKAVTKGANDAIVVSSIFDVFADHMSEVAEYNAFALPLVDAMKWYNYRDTTKLKTGQIRTRGVKKALNDTLGTAAGKYFIDLMTDINSSQKAGRYENLFGKLLSRSKASIVGWNLRVAIQQPTAILRASVYLSPGSLAKGALRIGTKKLAEEMRKHSGIALWKSLGYYDLNISRSVKNQIKGDTSVLDRMNELGMWLPGKMDEVTWARIWAACKAQVSSRQGLKSEALMQETAKLFDEVVYHTQVADSVLTRSSLMRSKSQTVKELTSFMAEPTLSANLLLSAFQDYREGVSSWDKVKRTMRIGFCGYVLSAVVNALVTSLADAGRDDDEYEEFYEKYLQAFFGEKFTDGNLFAELNPLEKIVFVRDVLSLLKGYDSKNPYIELVESCIDLVKNVSNFLEGKGSLTTYGVIYQALQVLGSFTGAAPANLLREVTAIWNNTFGKLSGKIIHRYETDKNQEIRDAYKSGALTNKEAQDALVEAGMAIADAYFKVKEWDTGSASRYTDIYNAVLNGEDISAQMKELTDHGKTEKEVLGELRKQIRKWYIDPDSDTRIDREQAQAMVDRYLNMESGDAEKMVEEWTFELEHGYSYDDIKQTYLDDEITAQEAKDVLINRVGKTEAEADRRIQYWDYLRNNRDSELTEYQVADFYEYAEPAGISAEVYEKYISGIKGIEGEGTKARKMAVIDSLPLTNAQKDALYFANDWAKSTLDEAPWH